MTKSINGFVIQQVLFVERNGELYILDDDFEHIARLAKDNPKELHAILDRKEAQKDKKGGYDVY